MYNFIPMPGLYCGYSFIKSDIASVRQADEIILWRDKYTIPKDGERDTPQSQCIKTGRVLILCAMKPIAEPISGPCDGFSFISMN